MSNTNGPYAGSCLCGEIRYEVQKIGSKMGHCHCSMCRKFHGAGFTTYGEAAAENFRWTSGKQLLKSFKAPNGTVRTFCSECGSSLTFASANDKGEVVEFALGTLDSEIPQRPDVHIFVGSKANWSTIADDLPQFEGDRQSRRLK
ncbi:GFA family protein [Hahella ganghwensis]|uniref:GFA family protein n=1 Tax=Hahella ganghwensis TaxID=286420 RepID=UPI00039C33F4|nr:GFA family protein [Hahella ganghwensis]